MEDNNDKLVGYQIAFDLYESATQGFIKRVTGMLASGEEQKKTENEDNNADKNKAATNNPAQIMPGQKVDTGTINNDRDIQIAGAKTFIKAGDILFAVMDTAVNSDQPGPILATIVSGKLKGSKLIGSFNLPTNSDRMLITFNLISIPGSNKTTSINAYAIDPNTGRTALSTRANHHYLLRYGSLFASTFLQGFGNAFQAAGTEWLGSCLEDA